MAAEGMAVKAFARGLGVSPAAVRRAAQDGRLTEASVGRNARGHLVIRDPAAARREWRAHTRVRIGIDTEGPRHGPERARAPRRHQSPAVLVAHNALVDLLAGLPRHVNAVMQETVKQLPAGVDFETAAWPALWGEISKIPAAIVALRDEVSALLHDANAQQEAADG